MGNCSEEVIELGHALSGLGFQRDVVKDSQDPPEPLTCKLT